MLLRDNGAGNATVKITEEKDRSGKLLQTHWSDSSATVLMLSSAVPALAQRDAAVLPLLSDETLPLLSSRY